MVGGLMQNLTANVREFRHKCLCAGGERILEVFEIKLKEAIQKLPFQKILTLKNVQQVVNEADGYQPHIIAPENGYRR